MENHSLSHHLPAETEELSQILRENSTRNTQAQIDQDTRLTEVYDMINRTGEIYAINDDGLLVTEPDDLLQTFLTSRRMDVFILTPKKQNRQMSFLDHKIRSFDNDLWLTQIILDRLY